MTPLEQLIVDAASLMNFGFIDEAKPLSVLCEFYHQFRKLWDRGIPVGMGLGHLLVKSIDGNALGIHRLGEGGKADEALAAVCYNSVTRRGDYECTIVLSLDSDQPWPGVIVAHCHRGRVILIR